MQSLSQCQNSRCFCPRSLCTLWFRRCRTAVFVSKNVNHASIFWSVSSHATNGMVEPFFFPFRLARLIDNTSWTHLAAAHKNISASHCTSSVNYAQPPRLCIATPDISLAIGVLTSLCTHGLRMHAVLSTCGKSLTPGQVLTRRNGRNFFRDVGRLKLFSFVNVDSRPILRGLNGSISAH